MRLTFGQPEEPETPRRGQPAPPNYRLRGVQFRLMMLVGAVMLTLVLMYEAGKPSNWEWMFNRGGRRRPTADGRDGVWRDVDTRVAPTVEKAPAVPGAVAMPQPGPVEVELNAAGDPLVQTLRDGWAKQWPALSDSGRYTLMHALMCSRLEKEFPAGSRNGLAAVAAKLNQGWQSYHINALEAVSTAGDELTPAQQEGWATVLEKTQAHWSAAHAGLQQLVEGLAPGGPQRQALEDVQTRLDELTLGLVEDNTLARFDERYSWFRLVEKLQRSTAAEQREQSLGNAGYLQLYDQPTYYRGRMVTVRGKARLAYRVPAPKNFYGVTHYYVFWLKPAGGPNSPLIVYAINLPENFPPVKDREDDPARNNVGDVEVEFDAYFFKRKVYNAQIGTHLAPMLLAATPVYTARPVFTSRNGDPPGILTMLLGIGAIALMATGIAVAAYMGSRWRSRRRLPTPSGSADRTPAEYFEHATVKPPVAEQLRLFAEERGNAGDTNRET